MEIDFEKKTGFICDMDGVLYHGNRLLPGASEFISWLQENQKEYLSKPRQNTLTSTSGEMNAKINFLLT